MINQTQEPNTEVLYCDECGSETDDPWHYSEGDNKHYHRCNTCHSKFQRKWVIGEYNMDDLTEAIFRAIKSSPYDVCVSVGAFEKAMVELTKDFSNGLELSKDYPKMQDEYYNVEGLE